MYSLNTNLIISNHIDKKGFNSNQILHPINFKSTPVCDTFVSTFEEQKQAGYNQVSFEGLALPQYVLDKLEQSFIFKPVKELEPMKESLLGKVAVAMIDSTDDVTLKCWYIRAKQGKPTVVFCHGNDKNMTNKQEIAEMLSDKGYGVILADYRGYGDNSGKPSEKGLYDDLKSVVKFLNDDGVKNQDIILWGHSLGGGVVTDIASKTDFKSVILESTFTSIEDMSEYAINNPDSAREDSFAMRILQALKKRASGAIKIKSKFANNQKIAGIKSPLLIIHSKEDTKIPYKMSEHLHSLNSHSKLVLKNKGEHTAHDITFPDVLQFIEEN